MARKPSSPYARYGKRPYRYSDAVLRLSALARAGQHDTEEYEALDTAFRRAHNLPPRPALAEVFEPIVERRSRRKGLRIIV